MTRPPPIEPDGLLDGIRWRIVVQWAALDLVLTMGILTAALFLLVGAEGFSEDEAASQAALDAVLASPGYLLLSALGGLAITVYVSFRAARAADVLPLRHGGWTAVVSAVFGALLLLSFPDEAAAPSTPAWLDGVSVLLMLPAGLLGGWLASRGRRLHL